VLDLDETLVHSSFKPVMRSDFIVPVEIDGKMTDVYVLKRPWVDLFMREVSKDWEIVVFTASLPKYANPVMDLLDVEKTVRWRLFRRHCYAFQGNYVKDLTSLGRDLSQTVIVDNSPYSYAFHPQNAFPISSFIDNPNDNELLNAIPYLRELARTKDVVEFLKKSRGCMPRQSYFSRKEIEEPAYDRVGNAIVP
jgi:RNA polymerase II subunit A small phosphatase-like protein|tara:strand:- start:985 stop:1566 length:582 start_codon:yes stop_codon:yes gene_type:complete